MQIVLPAVSENVKRLKCNDCLDIFLNIYKNSGEQMEPAATRSLVICVNNIFCSQELNPELWESGLVRRSFTMLLSLSMHSSGKVRRAVQDELSTLMQLHSKQGFAVTSSLAVHQLEVLSRSVSDDDYQDLLSYLLLVSRISPFIHTDHLSSLFSCLLHVPLLSPSHSQLYQRHLPLLDGHALSPILTLLRSDRFIPDSLLSSAYSQLQSQPPAESSASKDIIVYVHVMCLCSLHFAQNGDSSSLLAVLRGSLAYFATADASLHKSLSLLLMDFLPSLQTVVWIRNSDHM